MNFLRNIKLILVIESLSFITGCVSFDNFWGLSSSFTKNVPERASNALTGSQFLQKIQNVSGSERERLVLQELQAGNIPDFLKRLQPVSVTARVKNRSIPATIWVMPDYLAIGSNSDYVRIPMTPITAQKIADQYGFLLPTTKMVDDIYRQAAIKLTPRPLVAGPQMASSKFFAQHNLIISQQYREGFFSGVKIRAGHKKDIVMTNRLSSMPHRVAIYGWHRPGAVPIQPLSLVHGENYVDYSHGVRFVAKKMLVEGHEIAVAEVLTNNSLYPLLSNEGPIFNPRVQPDFLSASN